MTERDRYVIVLPSNEGRTKLIVRRAYIFHRPEGKDTRYSWIFDSTVDSYLIFDILKSERFEKFMQKEYDFTQKVTARGGSISEYDGCGEEPLEDWKV